MCFPANLETAAKGAETRRVCLLVPRLVSGAACSQKFFFFVHENHSLPPVNHPVFSSFSPKARARVSQRDSKMA